MIAQAEDAKNRFAMRNGGPLTKESINQYRRYRKSLPCNQCGGTVAYSHSEDMQLKIKIAIALILAAVPSAFASLIPRGVFALVVLSFFPPANTRHLVFDWPDSAEYGLWYVGLLLFFLLSSVLFLPNRRAVVAPRSLAVTPGRLGLVRDQLAAGQRCDADGRAGARNPSQSQHQRRAHVRDCRFLRQALYGAVRG